MKNSGRSPSRDTESLSARSFRENGQDQDLLDDAAGRPDGEYVVILYDTSFENKKSAVETVTQMIDKDGNWHVAGYYIK